MDKLPFLEHYQFLAIVALLLMAIFREKINNFFSLKNNIRQKLYRSREPIFVETFDQLLAFKVEVFRLFNQDHQNLLLFEIQYSKIVDLFSELDIFINKNTLYYPVDILENIRSIMKTFNSMMLNYRRELIRNNANSESSFEMIGGYKKTIEPLYTELQETLRYLLESNDRAKPLSHDLFSRIKKLRPW